MTNRTGPKRWHRGLRSCVMAAARIDNEREKEKTEDGKQKKKGRKKDKKS